MSNASVVVAAQLLAAAEHADALELAALELAAHDGAKPSTLELSVR